MNMRIGFYGVVTALVWLSAGCRRAEPAARADASQQPVLETQPTRGDAQVVAEAQPAVTTEFGIAYAPVDTARKREFTSRHLKALNVRRIRFNDEWLFREEQRGRYTWRDYDERMKWVKDNGLRVFLTIGNRIPEWARAEGGQNTRVSAVDERYLPDFRNYVAALLCRYPGLFDRIQFGNEWVAPYCYPGTAEDFVRESNIVYEEAGKHCPDAWFVLGGLATSTMRALAALEGKADFVWEEHYGDVKRKWRRIEGAELEEWKTSKPIRAGRARLNHVLANARYDVLDIHLYDDVENWPLYIKLARELAPGRQIQIIVSEFGGPNLYLEDYSDEYHASRVREYIRVIGQMGILEAYYWPFVSRPDTLSPNRECGLISGDLKTKPAYGVFQELANARR